jgi:hypothetical protein
MKSEIDIWHYVRLMRGPCALGTLLMRTADELTSVGGQDKTACWLKNYPTEQQLREEFSAASEATQQAAANTDGGIAKTAVVSPNSGPYTAIPSNAFRKIEKGQNYFYGGSSYTLQMYGSRNNYILDAFQMELPSSIRKTEETRKAYATHFANALAVWMSYYMDMRVTDTSSPTNKEVPDVPDLTPCQRRYLGLDPRMNGMRQDSQCDTDSITEEQRQWAERELEDLNDNDKIRVLDENDNIVVVDQECHYCYVKRFSRSCVDGSFHQCVGECADTWGFGYTREHCQCECAKPQPKDRCMKKPTAAFFGGDCSN